MMHELKVHPVFFERLADGSKTFEIRKDDRQFQAGDTLRLREWDASVFGIGIYTGRELTRQVGFTFRAGAGIDLGEYVILSLLPGGDAS